ncbi:MAG: rRNA maturation RNase YbeY [Gammaproteobacteria bacterium]|nr:rRNA maturation RNase YbeY [Gammaproteobacteria bacterium]
MATRAARLPRGTRLGAWVAAAGATGRDELTLRLVGWREGRRLNEQFRGRSGPTNVLAFSGTASGPHGPGTLGDLVICLPLVYREAREQGKQTLAHLAHLVVHGVLHLRGFDHDDAASARRMERAEVRILARLGFANPYRVPGSPVGARKH